MKFIVAIDGPAGTGKSSVARSVAQKLNFVYVDTGALYRALALLVSRAHINFYDEKEIVKLVSKIKVELDLIRLCTVIKIDNLLVDQELRSEEISKLSSVVSQHQEVREKLLDLQRNLVQEISNGAIFEGRDIGTVVFPKAPLKIYITATSETRAKRRYLELQKIHGNTSYQAILDAIELRDQRDKSRANAPMLQAHDAIIIDTSHMSLPEVITKTLDLIENKKAQQKKSGELPW